MSLELTMTMRDVFHKLTTDTIILDASYESREDVTFSDTNEFFVALANVCKRADDGIIIPFTDKSYPTRVSVAHSANYKQIEIKLDNGTFSVSTAARYSWSIKDVLLSLEGRYVTAWLQHLERIGQRRYYENDHIYNLLDWIASRENDKHVILSPPSPIWGKPSIQKVMENNTHEEVTGDFRDAQNFLTALRDTNKGTGVVFIIERVPSTKMSLEAIRVNAILTDSQNKVTQSVSWESVDKVESTVGILSTFFTPTELKCFSYDDARYVVKDVSPSTKIEAFLNTERPKAEKPDSAVIRTTYGSPTFEEDIRNWIIMQAEEMGVA